MFFLCYSWVWNFLNNFKVAYHRFGLDSIFSSVEVDDTHRNIIFSDDVQKEKQRELERPWKLQIYCFSHNESIIWLQNKTISKRISSFISSCWRIGNILVWKYVWTQIWSKGQTTTSHDGTHIMCNTFLWGSEYIQIVSPEYGYCGYKHQCENSTLNIVFSAWCLGDVADVADTLSPKIEFRNIQFDTLLLYERFWFKSLACEHRKIDKQPLCYGLASFLTMTYIC